MKQGGKGLMYPALAITAHSERVSTGLQMIQRNRFFSLSRELRVSSILGMVALGINVFSLAFSALAPVSFGSVFCIVAAITFGALPGALAATLSAIPLLAFLNDGTEVFRFILFMGALGFMHQRWKNWPAFFLIAILWMTYSSVALYLLDRQLQTHMMLAAFEITAGLFASLLLLHRGFWGWLTQKPRHTHLKDICTLSAASLVSLGFMAGSFIFWANNPQAFMEQALPLGIVSVMLLAATVVTFRHLGAFLQENIDVYVPKTLTQNTLSGLTASNWRREQPFGDGKELVKHWQTITNGTSQNASSREGIVAITEDGTISFVNRTFRRLASVQDPNVIGKSIFEIEIKKELLAALTEVFSSFKQARLKSVEVKLNELPEKLQFLELSAQKSEDSHHASLQSGPNSVVITLRDISEKRTVADTLLKGQKVSSLGASVSGLTHSLSNYLTEINGKIDCARRASNENTRDEALQQAAKATETAGRMIRRLTDFACSAPQKLEKENANLLLQNCFSLLQQTLGGDVDFRIELPNETLGIACDTNLITQAIGNLVINAKEAVSTNDSRRISVSASKETLDASVTNFIVGGRPGEFVRISVEDNGHGMTSDVLGKAFEPLFTTKQASGNTGLGLSTVYAIARAHDGFLSIESTPNKGTKVSLYIPYIALPDSQKPNQQHHEEVTTLQPSNEKILVVEDNEQVRMVVTQMLETLGYTVESYPNGADALTRAQDTTFDLLLVDMMMPDMNGAEVIERMQGISKSTKTLIMTGFGASEATHGNDTTVVQKPFNIDTLAANVHSALAKKERGVTQSAHSDRV